MLIATRNRPTEIQALLVSLLGQDIDQVVVAASGTDIGEIIASFKGSLAIDYVQSEAGQIRQKMTGIKTLRNDLDWVIFSDDDVAYPPTFVQALKKTIVDHDKPGLSGIGFQITNRKSVSHGKLKKFYNHCFFLQNGKPGMVNPSGDCIPYSDCKEPTTTMWLNGASAWRYKLVLTYTSPVPETRYAAYEDAVFSFGNFAPASLFYFPDLKLKYQAPGDQTQLDAITFESYLLWKMFFVAKFKLSVPKFMWSSCGLSMLYLIHKSSKDDLSERIKKVFQVLGYLTKIYLSHDREQETIRTIDKYLPKA